MTSRVAGARRRVAGRVSPARLRRLALLFGVVAVVVVTAALLQDQLLEEDRELLGDLRLSGTARDAARGLTHLGAPLLVEVAAVAGAVALWRRRRREALVVLLGVFGAVLLSTLAKLAVERPRPCLLELPGCPSSYSFPSGHSVAAAAGWLALALVVQRRWAWAGAAGVPLLVGATRIGLGVHYPTDVAAGLALGWGWVWLCHAVLVRGWPGARSR